MTVRSTTMDNKEIDELDSLITQRLKDREILTDMTSVEEMSVEFTSVSTTQNYRNFTSTTNDDENVT